MTKKEVQEKNLLHLFVVARASQIRHICSNGLNLSHEFISNTSIVLLGELTDGGIKTTGFSNLIPNHLTKIC